MMRLAIIDERDRVIVAWPTALEAHDDIAGKLAADLDPMLRWRWRKRGKVEQAIRDWLVELQRTVTRL